MSYKSGQYALNKEQANDLIDSFSNLQDKALIAVAISIGLRRDDLVKIRKENYNKENGSITYYEKKKDRIRTLYIPSQKTVKILNNHLNSCRESEWLFPSPKVTGKYKNAHMCTRQCYDILQEQLKVIGLSGMPFHALRATCYQLLQNSGWAEKDAIRVLGISPNVAATHYDAPSMEEMKDISKEKQIF